MLSKSKIGTWKRCPFLFKLQYVDKLQIKAQNEAMSRGIEIHTLLEEFYKPNSRELKVLIEEIQKHPLFPKHSEAIANFINFNKRITSPFPILTEKMLKDDDKQIRGIIDRVDEDDKGNLILIDYKSGRINPISKYRFELALYAYLYEINHDRKITHWGIYFVDYDVFNVERAERNDIQDALKKVETTRCEIEDAHMGNNFPKSPGSHCNWCEAKTLGYCEGR